MFSYIIHLFSYEADMIKRKQYYIKPGKSGHLYNQDTCLVPRFPHYIGSTVQAFFSPRLFDAQAGKQWMREDRLLHFDHTQRPACQTAMSTWQRKSHINKRIVCHSFTVGTVACCIHICLVVWRMMTMEGGPLRLFGTQAGRQWVREGWLLCSG